MTHEELDNRAPQIEKNCNYLIGEGFPKWSRYAVRQMIEQIMQETAPQWDYAILDRFGATPEIVLTEYRGPVA